MAVGGGVKIFFAIILKCNILQEFRCAKTILEKEIEKNFSLEKLSLYYDLSRAG